MKQAKLIRIASEKTDHSIWEYHIILNAFVETVTEILKSGETVKLRMFGNFKVKTLRTKHVRNKRNGVMKALPSRRKVVFLRARTFDLNQPHCHVSSALKNSKI